MSSPAEDPSLFIEFDVSRELNKIPKLKTEKKITFKKELVIIFIFIYIMLF
jgi:hypothetical protein